MKPFETIIDDVDVLKGIAARNYKIMTPIQEATMGPILAGMDVMAKAPTGTGKTGAYAIPLISRMDATSRSVKMLVLCPTRELAIQSLAEIQALAQFKEGVRALALYGGESIERQFYGLKQHPQIIVATPGRLMDHQRRGTVQLDELEYLVLDEADEMLKMGFKEDIDQILTAVEQPHQTVLFSATIPTEIKNLARNYLVNHLTFEVAEEKREVARIQQYYIDTTESNKTETLCRLLDARGHNLSMVFCRTKQRVDQLTMDLQTQGYLAEALHGDLKQIQRDRVMKLVRSGRIQVLIATDVAARGLDITDVEAVYNYDVSPDPDFYLHRIGRTGRADKHGVSYTFINRRERDLLPQYEGVVKASIERLIPPTSEQAQTIRLASFMETLTPFLDNDSYQFYLDAITGYLARLNEQGKTHAPLDVAAALLAMKYGNQRVFAPVSQPEYRPTDGKRPARRDRGDDAPRRERSDDAPRREHRTKEGAMRLFVNLGKKDGISKGELSSLFQKMSGVAGADLYDVFVQDSYSFVEMPEAFAIKAMKRMSGMDYQGRLVVVEHAVARGDEAKGFSKKRSDAPRFPAKKREGRSYEGDAKPARKPRKSDDFSSKKKSYNR